MRLNDPEPTLEFVQGECICKTCKSTNLRFVPYLEDAKCLDCRQYQGEETIPC